MDEQQIQDIADRVIDALNNLVPSPTEPNWWEPFAAFGSYVALTAAAVAFIIGWKNLKHQQKALRSSIASDARNLRQKRDADARSEWWRRTQWALEATASEDTTLYGYGVAMLEVLATSDLARPEDKKLIDAVWEGSSTEMQDDEIDQLIEDAAEQEDLDYEELLSVASYDPQVAERLTSLGVAAAALGPEELRDLISRMLAASDEQAETAVDGDTASGDNRQEKEAGNDAETDR